MAASWKSRRIIGLVVAGLSIWVPATPARAEVFVDPATAGVINVRGPVLIGNDINAPIVVSASSSVVPIT